MYAAADLAALTAGRTLHEGGIINNVCADWGMAIGQGLLGRRRVAEETRARARPAGDAEAVEFSEAAIETIDAVLALVARYAAEARRLGKDEVAEVLERVPAEPAATFHEALQSLRFLQAMVWLSGHHHVGLGRLDQYLWPYLSADLEAGRLDEAGAEELLAEFFIALNRDSDLYPGIQQGDNGQSMTLGGVTPDGRPAVNPLTWMALRVARDVGLIDPKVNLRISADTDQALLELGTELTRRGLGFPQYANDDVVIPALASHGYDLEDARDYTVAACWEFIIPGRGMDVGNIGAVSFPAAADAAIREGLAAGPRSRTSWPAPERHRGPGPRADRAVRAAPVGAGALVLRAHDGRPRDTAWTTDAARSTGTWASTARPRPAPPTRWRPCSGTSSSSGTSRRASCWRPWRRTSSATRRCAGGWPRRARAWASTSPPWTACCACSTTGWPMPARPSGTASGLIVRPGTGTAMYYLWLARGRADGPLPEPVVGATADGRHRGDPFGANLAPTPGTPLRGPISVLQSYAKIDYGRICNGGPITLELSDSVFRSRDSISKVAGLVRTFAQLGGQQLQLNALSASRLLDAKAHPEEHRDLIVRVWGWSGYFCELSPEYQDHVISRHLYAEV